MAIYSSVLAWKFQGGWWATVHGIEKRHTWAHMHACTHTHTHTHTLKILQPQNAINIKHEWATAVSIYFGVVFNIKCSDKLGAWD